MEPTPAKLRIVERSRRDSLGEGPVWCPQDRALYWVDIIGQKVNRLGLDDGTVADWDCPEMIGWLLPRAQGGFIAGLKSGFHTLTLEPFTLERIHAPEPDRPGNRMNDACVDARGRIWAGTMQMDGQGAGGHLYRLDHDLSVRRVDEGYHIANGPTISGDGTTLYHTDSLLGRLSLCHRRRWRTGSARNLPAIPGRMGIARRHVLRQRGRHLDRALGRGLHQPLPARWHARALYRAARQPDHQMRLRGRQAGPHVRDQRRRWRGEDNAGCLFEVETGFTGLPPHTFAA
jgi:sugar lactone lactonase YvrE